MRGGAVLGKQSFGYVPEGARANTVGRVRLTKVHPVAVGISRHRLANVTHVTASRLNQYEGLVLPDGGWWWWWSSASRFQQSSGD